MFTIVGLGNPGEKYENTRHNAGQLVVEDSVRANGLPPLVASAKYMGKISEAHLEGQDLLVLIPETYMNKSGSSVQKAVSKENAENLIVLYDDIDLPFGEVKVSFGRGAGGHNGLASIIQSIGTKNFIRIRIGIAPKGFFGNMKRPKREKMPRYVLGKMKKKELVTLSAVSKTVESILKTILREGKEKAMNQYN